MRRMLVSALLLIYGSGLSLAADNNWPQFRGSSSGQAMGMGFPATWDTAKNVLWKTKIPGRGWSSPIVWGDRVFVTGVVADGNAKLPRKGLYIQDVFGKVQPGLHRWKVYCLDWKSGKILWERTAHKGKPLGAIHGKNSYATETPVTDGQRVYAYFGNVGLFCFDLKGKPLWSRSWGSYKTRMGWGPAASPVLHKGRIYIVNDNDEKSFLTAVDAKTGDEVWRVERREKSNWATPFVWENDKRNEIITPGTGKVRSYGLDGKLLWELGGMSSIAIPTPSAGPDLLYISSGYVMDLKRPVFAVRPGAKGDITLKEGQIENASIAWCQRLAGPYNPSPVVHRDRLYVLYDRGLLACYNAKTGNEIYKKKRLPGGTAFTASPWVAGDKIYCLSEDGDTYVVQAGDQFKLLGKNRLDDMCLATPAAVRGSFLIRTANRLYRIGQPEGK